MLTNPSLKSQIDGLWDYVWTNGLNNPLDAIEHISYLLFLKRFDDAETAREANARRREQPFDTRYINQYNQPDETLRWGYWTQLPAAEALKQVKTNVFPFLKTLGAHDSSFELQMETAEFKISKPALLIEAARRVNELQISHQNQDVQGDLYEYLLSRLSTAGVNGQFRTPRHIIRLMVQMLDVKPLERICDPAAGTCGFLVNAHQYVLEKYTDPQTLTYDEDGFPHNLVGDRLNDVQRDFAQREAYTGFDADSGRAMHRIGSMNLLLHGIAHPRFHYADALSKGFTEARQYDVILANPPFKGAIDASDVNPTLPVGVRKTEILFLHLFLRLLEMGGRCAAIVPDGVLFGSSRAHLETRKLLIEQNRLEAVISMPSGVFRPYAGVSTAILIFTKGGTTDDIWFYDMEHDGYSLDDKRLKVPENDLPDILDCWRHRRDANWNEARAARAESVRELLSLPKRRRLDLHREINRLTYENVLDDGAATRTALEADRRKLAELGAEIGPLQSELNQLTRQFCVRRSVVAAQKYDLSASRYRKNDHDETFYDEPQTTLQRLLALENFMASEARELQELIS